MKLQSDLDQGPPPVQSHQTDGTSLSMSSGTETKIVKPKEKSSHETKGHFHTHKYKPSSSKTVPKREDPFLTLSELGELAHMGAKDLGPNKSS